MSSTQSEIIINFSFEERELFGETAPEKQDEVLLRIAAGEHALSDL